jgi:hypothetical protein
LLDASDVGPGLFGPDDERGHPLRLAAHLLPIGHGQAELGEDLFVRDGIIVLAPLLRLGDGLRFGRAERVAILDVIVPNHNLREMNDGCEFVGFQLPDQFVRLAFEDLMDDCKPDSQWGEMLLCKTLVPAQRSSNSAASAWAANSSSEISCSKTSIACSSNSFGTSN